MIRIKLLIRIKPTQISKKKLSRKNSLVAKEHILIVNKHALKTYTNCESFSFSVNTNLYQRCFPIMFFVNYLCINPLNMTYNKENFTELCNYHIHTHLFKITAYRPPPPLFFGIHPFVKIYWNFHIIRLNYLRILFMWGLFL